MLAQMSTCLQDDLSLITSNDSIYKQDHILRYCELEFPHINGERGRGGGHKSTHNNNLTCLCLSTRCYLKVQFHSHSVFSSIYPFHSSSTTALPVYFINYGSTKVGPMTFFHLPMMPSDQPHSGLLLMSYLFNEFQVQESPLIKIYFQISEF